MTDLTTRIADVKKKAEAATPGPWHHCQPFEVVPAQRTIHGPVPAQRVDYVSTWPDLGTPKGHRVVIPMPGQGGSVKSEDMAYIAAASPDLFLAMEAEIARLRAELERAREALARARETADVLSSDGSR